MGRDLGKDAKMIEIRGLRKPVQHPTDGELSFFFFPKQERAAAMYIIMNANLVGSLLDVNLHFLHSRRASRH